MEQLESMTLPEHQKLTRAEFALIALDEILGFPDLNILAEAIKKGNGVFDSSQMDSAERVDRAIQLREILPLDLVLNMTRAMERFTDRR